MPRFLLIPFLVALVGGHVAAAETPPAHVPATAVEAQTVSAAVSAGLAKIRMRVDAAKGAGGKVSVAGIADAMARIAKLDDAVESPADMGAILAAARDMGLVDAKAVPDYPSLLMVAKGGAVTAAPAVAATPAAKAQAIASVAKPEFEMTPGAKARLFVFNATDKFPPKDWPAVPISTVPIPAIDDVLPHWVQRPGIGEVPNHLIENGALDSARWYGVEFSGAYYASQAGPVAITVESDDPVTVEVGGKPVVASDWSIKFEDWAGSWANGNTINPREKSTNVAVGPTQPLVQGRYYPVRILCAQSWRREARADDSRGWAAGQEELHRRWAPTIAGAMLKIRVTRPDAEPEPIKLYIQRAKKSLKDD